MPLNISKVYLSVVIIILLSGCRKVLHFECNDGTISLIPCISPKGFPPGDRIDYSQGSSRIIYSDVFNSAALQFERGNYSGIPFIEFIAGSNTSAKATSYTINMLSYSEYVNQTELTIDILSKENLKALRLVLNNGTYYVIDANGKRTIGIYDNYQINEIIIKLNNNHKNFTILIHNEIKDTILNDTLPYIDESFREFKKIRFEYPPAILESVNGRHIIKSIKAFKQ